MILRVGEHEELKAAYHALLLGLLAGAGLYNASAFFYRGLIEHRWQRHLAVNAAIDAALVVWEAGHVRAHTDKLV